MKRLVKGVWFMTTFYCSLKLIFTIVDDICLQLIRKRSRSLFSSHEMIFLSSAVKRAETSRKTISIFVLKHSRVGCFSLFFAQRRDNLSTSTKQRIEHRQNVVSISGLASNPHSSCYTINEITGYAAHPLCAIKLTN